MSNSKKYPEIWAVKQAAEDELAELMAARKVHTDAIGKVQLKIEPLRKEKERLNELAMADIDRIRELNIEIGRCATAMGGITAGRVA